MRLSTDADRDSERSIATLTAAFDAGVTLFDTADAYCHHSGEAGHNERLIASALGGWEGDRSRILVITKGGLTRPLGQWVPDGRARHLAAACEASLRALGLDQLPLYQLHVPDSRVPFATSVRALDALRRRGYIAAVGLCNVTLAQLQEARQITEIATVQVELSPWHDAATLSGLVPYCEHHDIRLLAHRPFGGVRRIAWTLKEPGFIAAAAETDDQPPSPLSVSRAAGKSFSSSVCRRRAGAPGRARRAAVIHSWRPVIDEGTATREHVDEAMRRVVDQLGVPMEFLYCSHRAGPPVCWCPSPLPGLGALAIERYGIDPSASLCVGRGPHDAGFARKLGLPYRNAAEFFGT